MATKTFISYIVNNDPNKYPSNGLHTDGYWYEKVVEGISPEMFGCTKMAVDTFTLTSDNSISSTVKINHSLGEVPKIMFIIAEEFSNSATTRYIKRMSGVYDGDNIGNGGIVYEKSLTESGTLCSLGNATNLILSLYYTASYYFKAKIKYTLVTMA